jgi:hypothetical protein
MGRAQRTELYFDVACAWSEFMWDRLPDHPTWRTLADILYAATIYE